LTQSEAIQDLVVLVSDKNMEFTIRGLFTKPQAFSIRSLSHNILIHPERDPGCLLRAHDFLRPSIRQYAHALVMLDRQGCGKDGLDRSALENELEQRLFASGWLGRAAAIVIDPELEAWVWSDSPFVDAALGWQGHTPTLRNWLRDRKYCEGTSKPSLPKEALHDAIRVVSKPRSSNLYYNLASSVEAGRWGQA
jgi:hypothetical protein